MDTSQTKLNFLQWNTDFSKAATLLLEKFMEEYNTDAAFIQDIYCEKFGLDQLFMPPTSKGYNLLYFKGTQMPKVALYVKSEIKTTFLPQASNTHCITCIIHLEDSKQLVLSSVYSPPPDISPLLRINSLFQNLSTCQGQSLLLCGDFNSHSSLWSNRGKNDKKGDDLEAFLLQYDLNVLNDVNSPPTFENSRGGASWIDISIAGCQIVDKISDWKVHEEECLSFHKVITFTFNVSPSISSVVRYNFGKTDWLKFNNNLSLEFAKNGVSVTTACDSEHAVEDLAKRATISLRDTIISTVPSTVNFKKRKLVSWWNKDISEIRKKVNRARRQKQKNPCDENSVAYKNLKNQ